jgi:hypothetical protein
VCAVGYLGKLFNNILQFIAVDDQNPRHLNHIGYYSSKYNAQNAGVTQALRNDIPGKADSPYL